MVSVFNTTYRSCINCYFYTTEWVGRNSTAVYTISKFRTKSRSGKKEEQELPAPHPDQLKKDKAKAQASPTEIVEERTETEKVFDNNDGTFTKRVYTEPIHAEKDGKLEEVSPKLVEAPNEKIVTENTTLEPEFEKATQDGKYVQFKVKDHTIQYKLISANGEKGEMKPSPVTATHENNTVWYKGSSQILI